MQVTRVIPNDEMNPVGALYPKTSGNGNSSSSCIVTITPVDSVVGKYSDVFTFNKTRRPTVRWIEQITVIIGIHHFITKHWPCMCSGQIVRPIIIECKTVTKLWIYTGIEISEIAYCITSNCSEFSLNSPSNITLFSIEWAFMY